MCLPLFLFVRSSLLRVVSFFWFICIWSILSLAVIDDITSRQFPVFQTTGLTPGDFVHLAAAVGTANCPGAPRLQFMFGCPPPVAPTPDLTVPEPIDSVTAILTRFADAGFTPPEVVALLSSHTIAAADVVNVIIPGTPFDSTVGTFTNLPQRYPDLPRGPPEGFSLPRAHIISSTSSSDLLIIPFSNGSQPGEVLSPLHGEMHLQSDFELAHDSRTTCLRQAMINDLTPMQTQFKAAMAKLQVLGQKNLIDCSDVVPVPAAFPGPIKFPASFSKKDVEQACPSTFPNTVAGSAPTVAPVPSS
ncbi:heme peroxidase [Cyathus striatus]|nr:heme peroxidase [Cyathus striatus]